MASYNGTMLWTPHHEFISGCIIDASDYPFDQHTCIMWFQTISDTSRNFNLELYEKSPLDLSTTLHSYRVTTAWKITNNETEKVEYPSQRGVTLVYSNRPALNFTLTARRRPNFQAYLILVPCLVLPLLATSIFSFPLERPDRTAVGKYKPA